MTANHLKPIHNPADGPMPVIGFMSGEGTNLEKLLRLERDETMRAEFLGRGVPCPYKIVALFTDNPESNAQKLGDAHGLPVVVRDIRKFYEERNAPLADQHVRVEFDAGSVVELKKVCDAKSIVCAGYLKRITEPITKVYVGVNVHPADLSILGPGGTPRYACNRPVEACILAGEEVLRSTTHLIDNEGLMTGRLLFISRPLHVLPMDAYDLHDPAQLREVANYHMRSLKGIGDWDILPATLCAIAAGLIEEDDHKTLHFLKTPIPQGIRVNRFTLKDHF